MPPKRPLPNRWLDDPLSPHELHRHRVKRWIVRKKTRFQNAVVADTYAFGRCLVLDGEIQSAESDEYIYHEALVHPAVITHGDAKSVLVLGGGEGATIREILKHKSVTSVVMVDLDADVIEFCRKHLRSWHRGCFSDHRLELVLDDAKAYVERTTRRFDVIICDLPTPTGPGPVHKLYTIEFHRSLRRTLNKGGVFLTQAGSGGVHQLKDHALIHSTVRRSFKIVRPYYVHIPSFDVPWAYVLGTDGRDPGDVTAGEIDRSIRQRITGPLLFYDGQTHVGLFNLPKHYRSSLAQEKRVMRAST